MSKSLPTLPAANSTKKDPLNQDKLLLLLKYDISLPYFNKTTSIYHLFQKLLIFCKQLFLYFKVVIKHLSNKSLSYMLCTNFLAHFSINSNLASAIPIFQPKLDRR